MPTGRTASPTAKCPHSRPARRESNANLVLTMWEWGGPTGYVHDEVSTDKRNPTHKCKRPGLRRHGYGKDGISILNVG